MLRINTHFVIPNFFYNEHNRTMYFSTSDIITLEIHTSMFTRNMTGFDVNYTNAGQYTTYEDGTPTYLSFDMSFQELNPIYSEDYESEEGLEGVGF